jgi:hypothetical protein
MRTTSILFGVLGSVLMSTTHAQLSLGPSARGTYLSSDNQYLFGFGVDLSGQLSSKLRWTFSPYWNTYKDRLYTVNLGSPAGIYHPISSQIKYEHAHWGLSLDLEWTVGKRGWFLLAGLGFSNDRTVRTKMVIDPLMPNMFEEERTLYMNRKLMLNVGVGKRWKAGNGELRSALTVGACGYNLDHPDEAWRLNPMVSLSLGYQFNFSKKKR